MHDNQGDRLYPGEERYLSAYPGSARSVARPLPVTLIAIFQFAKGWFLLLVVAVERFAPQALQQLPALPSLIYFAAHGRDTRGLLMPFVGVYAGVVGWGLWSLKRWARRSLIASSGLMLAIWVHRFAEDWMAGANTLRTPLEQQTIAMVLFLDVVMLLYMVVYDDVPQAFAEQENARKKQASRR